MQPSVTMLYPSKHGNGAREHCSVYLWKQLTELGHRFESRNLFEVFISYQVSSLLFSNRWKTQQGEWEPALHNSLCIQWYRFQNGQVPKPAENVSDLGSFEQRSLYRGGRIWSPAMQMSFLSKLIFLAGVAGRRELPVTKSLTNVRPWQDPSYRLTYKIK